MWQCLKPEEAPSLLSLAALFILHLSPSLIRGSQSWTKDNPEESLLPLPHLSIKAIPKNTLMSTTSLVDISVGDALVVSGTENKTHDLCFHFILVGLTLLTSWDWGCVLDTVSFYMTAYVSIYIFLHRTLINKTVCAARLYEAVLWHCAAS